MDFDSRLRQLEHETRSNTERLVALKASLKDARKFTAQFLARCKEAGVTNVAIRHKHESVPASMSFPFGPGNSVFQFPSARDKSGWPAIWGVVRELGIGGGCGNSDQHQLSESPDKVLVDGVYALKAGKWSRVDVDTEQN